MKVNSALRRDHRRRWIALACAMICLVAGASLTRASDSETAAVPDGAGRDIRVKDDNDREVRLSRPAERIICLYGAYNEILAAMGLESRLVGRTKADDLPPSIRSKPSVGTHMRPNIELVLELKPDLIIQGAGRRQAMATVDQLRNHGIQVAVFNPVTFSELFAVITRMGTLTGAEGAAAALIASMQSRLEVVEKKIAVVSSRPRVFFEVRYPNLLASGSKSIVHDVIKRAGGENVTPSDKRFVRIGMEALIGKYPDVYVVQKGPMNPNPGNPTGRPHYDVVRAVTEKRILMVDEQVFSRPGPRSADAVEELFGFLHGDRRGSGTEGP
ncbi:MAG: helical backbone metal receptor [Pseudomonadota bacterium]